MDTTRASRITSTPFLLSLKPGLNATNGSSDQTAAPDPTTDILGPLTKDDFIGEPLPHSAIICFICLYVIIILLAFFGNSLVIWVIAKSKVRSATDIFIISLAVSDLMIAIFNMPFQLYYYVQNEWNIGEPMCKFTNYIQAATVVCSILTLTAIGIDRYFAICHPLKARHIHNTRTAIIVVCTLWAASLLISVPQLRIQRIDIRLKIEPDNPAGLGIAYLCGEAYGPINIDSKVYNLLIYIFVYIVPTLTMFISYGAICHMLWVRKPVGNVQENPRYIMKEIRRKKQLMKMLVALVLLFCVCWLPFFTISLYQEFNERTELSRLLKPALQLVGYSNSCINPFIYTFRNRNFRVKLRASLLCCCKQRSRMLNGDAMSSTLADTDSRNPAPKNYVPTASHDVSLREKAMLARRGAKPEISLVNS